MESELDPKLDPPFYRACKDEIGKVCGEKVIASKGISFHLISSYLLPVFHAKSPLSHDNIRTQPR